MEGGAGEPGGLILLALEDVTEELNHHIDTPDLHTDDKADNQTKEQA